MSLGTNLRDIKGKNELNQPNAPAASGKNYLFVIGVDDYIYCPRLFNAVNDAKAFVEVMTTQYQFDSANVKTCFNKEATHSNILKYFRNLAAMLTPDDHLIVYYSGHGEYDTILKEGYWIPVEVKQGDFAGYIPNSSIKSILDAINSRHTVLIVDSCFSGSLFTSFRGISDRLETMASRWCLTSGRNELVADGQPGDNSPFADALLEVLSTNKEPMSIATVSQRVVEMVANSAAQTPRGEPLNMAGNKGGQFFFHPKVTNVKPIAPVAPKKHTETSVGNIGYDIPDKMEVNIEIECLVRVAFDKLMLMENLDKNKVLDIVERRISNQMGVELIDASDEHPFVIKTYNTAEQLVAPDTYTEWIFYITPTKAGKYPLILKVYIVELVNDEKLRRELVFRELVEVVTAQITQKPTKRSLKAAPVSLVLGGSSSANDPVMTTVLPPPTTGMPTSLPQTSTVLPKAERVIHKASNGRMMKIIGTAAAFLVLMGVIRPYIFNNEPNKTPDSVVITEPKKTIELPPTLDTLKNMPSDHENTEVAATETRKTLPQNPKKEPSKIRKNNIPAKKTNNDIVLAPNKKPKDLNAATQPAPETTGKDLTTARTRLENPNPIAVSAPDSAELRAKNVHKDSASLKKMREKARYLDSLKKKEAQKQHEKKKDNE
jgi:Caspase domain